MGRNIEQEGKDFFNNHANITDSNAQAKENGSSRYAHEQICDDLKKAVVGMSAAEREKFYDTIAAESQKTSGEYAEFKEVNGHLHVFTRGLSVPLNFGMTRDTDLEELMKTRGATDGGHGWDGE